MPFYPHVYRSASAVYDDLCTICTCLVRYPFLRPDAAYDTESSLRHFHGTAGMGSADIDVEWQGNSWAGDMDRFAFLFSFLVSFLEALLKMVAFGMGLRKKKSDGRIKRMKQLTAKELQHVDDTFNLIDTKGLGTLNLREFRVALREIGRERGLFLYQHEVKKLYEEVDSEHGIEVVSFIEF